MCGQNVNSLACLPLEHTRCLPCASSNTSVPSSHAHILPEPFPPPVFQAPSPAHSGQSKLLLSLRGSITYSPGSDLKVMEKERKKAVRVNLQQSQRQLDDHSTPLFPELASPLWHGDTMTPHDPSTTAMMYRNA